MESLKKAIHAYGRAREQDKAATRRHIISEARRLKRPDLIPEDWLTAAGVVVAAMTKDDPGTAVRGRSNAAQRKAASKPTPSGTKTPTTPAPAGESDSSGYREEEHPRGIDGTWIEKGGDVNYVDPETGEESRATVVGFDADGNAILKFKESGETRTVPKDKVGDTVKGAPKRMATLWKNPNEGGALEKKGGGGGGGGGSSGKGGGGGGKSDADKAAADKEKADKQAAQDAAKAKREADQAAAKVAREAKQAATEKAREERLKDTAEGKRVVLPSDVTEGATVSLGTDPKEWKVTRAYAKPDGTRVVDMRSADGKVETGYPITGPKGRRLTQAEAKMRVKKRGKGVAPAAPRPVEPLATNVRPGQVSWDSVPVL